MQNNEVGLTEKERKYLYLYFSSKENYLSKNKSTKIKISFLEQLKQIFRWKN